MTGPKAPKDPTKKRPSFCIMKNKDIAAMPAPDGKGVTYIYESDGRLLSAARLVGGMTDEEVINLLSDVTGFRKLVHSIGVTIEADNKDEEATFVFQMYGKTDLYGSGTNIVIPVKMNGMEHMIIMEDIDWSDDDDVPGQIRYEFDQAGQKASVTVRLYLNDGYTAPKEEEEFPVDFASSYYKGMIDKSLLQKGNNYRVKKALDKAKSGEKTTVAFIGGSITQGAGAVPINTECYARKIFEGFCDLTHRGYEDNVRYIKAGVGGTPSEVGILRYEEDVLKEGTPDLVVVEFAVNDEGDETKGDFYDSLVRKIYEGPGKPAVILLFAVFANDWNLQDRLGCVGESYKLPMISTKDTVVEQFYLKVGEGKVISKNQFFYDMFHPTNDGHKIMADGVINYLKIADAEDYDDELISLSDIKAPKSADFENIILIDSKHNPCGAKIDVGSFTSTDKDIQCVERNMDLFTSPEFANNWQYEGTKNVSKEYDSFKLDVVCTSAVLAFKDSADNSVGKADVFVDGKKLYYADPRVVGWTHCNAAILFRNEERINHHIEVKMAEGSANKDFTILGIGVVI